VHATATGRGGRKLHVSLREQGVSIIILLQKSSMKVIFITVRDISGNAGDLFSIKP
jgi:hypothetical protein